MKVDDVEFGWEGDSMSAPETTSGLEDSGGKEGSAGGGTVRESS